jgi:tryptophan-rich sensory protein
MRMPPQTAPRLFDYVVLALFVVIIMGTGSYVGYITGGGQSPWFIALTKPPFNPPGYLFGIVWPILYALMAVAAWRIWRLPASKERTRGLNLFVLQLLINFCWSFIFFVAHQIAIGAIWIALLVGVVLLVMKSFKRLDPVSMLLLTPYLAWISFATVLNASFWALNPQASGF